MHFDTAVQPKKRPAMSPSAGLSPVRASHPASPYTPTPMGGNLENLDSRAKVISLNSVASRQRQPFSTMAHNLPSTPKEKESRRNSKVIARNKENGSGHTPPSAGKRNSILKDLTGLHERNVGQPTMVVKPKSFLKSPAEMDVSLSMSISTPKKDDSVRKRVNEWEREKERLREMERLEAFEKERDSELERAKQADESTLNMSMCSTVSLPLSPDESIQVAQIARRAPAQMVPTPPSFLGKLYPSESFKWS